MIDFSRDVHCLLGLPFDALDMNGAVARFRDAAHRRSPCFISTPNVHFVISCRYDAPFRQSVLSSDLSVADGMPLVWIARLLGIPIRERISGSDLFDRLRDLPGKPIAVYFLGGQEGAAEAAFHALNTRRAPGMVAVGFENPGTGSLEELSQDDIIERINASGADFLMVSLGTRKGQIWITRNRNRINAPVVAYFGAVVNFVAGTVRRAPVWMQHSGLEWLWRIKQERSLWRRYLGDGLQLLWLLATRVFPYAWHLRFSKPDADRPAGIEVSEQGQLHVIRLYGPWSRENLGPLRACFSKAASVEKDIRLELGEVTRADSAFVGLVALLSGFQAENERHLVLGPTSRPVQRILRFCCAEYLCAPPPLPAKRPQKALSQSAAE